jgi:para-nitrobenzyl esterase
MSNSENRVTLNRREALFLAAAGGIGAALARPAYASDSTKTGVHQEPGFCSTPKSAVANTQYGKVRGFVSGDVFTFKGIPYGQNTGGENRWLPAKPPVPWTGEYPALIYGGNCPQSLHNWTGLEQSFLQDWDDGYQSEDMLKLNIWTSSLSGKRPVMFYIHGGGFEFGSAYELPSHEGAQMARHHDVVQVSVNHRLNVLGFLDVSEVGGSAYEDSSNVGMTDLVEALRWIHENITSFGGDPDRVMIYGQSGGGTKVLTLMAMPSAAGLFHCTAVQSAGRANYPSSDLSKEFTRQVMKELGLAPHDIGALQKVEWGRLMAAASAAAVTVNTHRVSPALFPSMPASARIGHFWMPTVDGHIMNRMPFEDAAPEISKDVPMLIGSVSEEGNHMLSRPTEEQWHASLAGVIGNEKATALIAAMKKTHLDKSIRTLSYGASGVAACNLVQHMAKLKYDLRAAPVYQYIFRWQSPMLEDAGAWHTADLQFCFDNTKRCEQGTGNTPEAQVLARKMATAWANFARTGNPSQPGLTWEPLDPVRNQTMVWDNHCRMEDDPEGEARKTLLD